MLNETNPTDINKDILLRDIVSAAFNGIITINEHGIIDSFNPAACNMFGYEEPEIIGQNVSVIVAAPHNRQHDDYIQRYITTNEAHIVGLPREVIAQHKNGTTFPIELFITARQHGEHWVFIGIMHNISKRKAMEAELKTQATTDGLTGVRNRAYFNATLSAEFKRATRYKQHLSLLMLDADHFKSINDHYGHCIGDAMLIAIAQKAKESARETDTVARYGGEEFAIILPETDGHAALQLADRLRLSIATIQIRHTGEIIRRTVSIGVASLQDSNSEHESDLLNRADQALYHAKEAGRNCVILSHAPKT